jgi:glycosyltransferase involved in cell wall biosynthesis
MKILMIPSWYLTEDKPMNGIFFKEQAQALRQAGHDVCIIYPDLRFKLGLLKRGIFKAEGEPPTYLCRMRSLTPFMERGRWPQRELMLEKLFARVQKDWGFADVVHLQSCRMGVETLALCKKHSLPLVYTEHYSGVTRKMGAPLQEAFEKTLTHCDRAIAVSGYMREFMLPYRNDTLTIPNLVDTDEFHIINPPDSQKEFIFAAMGNLIPVKGYEMLIRAFSQVRGELTGARLVIAGEGAEREKLEKLVVALGAADKIQLCGTVERKDAPAFFNNCSCLVCASVSETFGMTLIEALACGRPVISTKCGGPQSIVTPQNGLLVGVGDIAAMADAMRCVYHNRGRFGSQSLREDCVRRFGSEAVTASLTEVYRSVLKRRGG